MKAYQLDDDGFVIGLTEGQPSPKEPGKFLIPGGAVVEPPPSNPDATLEPRHDGTAWVFVESRLEVIKKEALEKEAKDNAAKEEERLSKEQAAAYTARVTAILATINKVEPMTDAEIKAALKLILAP